MKKILFILLLIFLTIPAQTMAARLWSTGFELGSVSNAVEFDVGANTMTIESTIKRSGQHSGEVSSLVSGVRQVLFKEIQQGGSTNGGPYYLRGYLYVNTFPSAENYIMAFAGAGAVINPGITINSSGQLTLRDEDGVIGSPSTALSTGTWYRIEIEYDKTGAAGSHIVGGYIDGTQFARATNRDLSLFSFSTRWGGNLNLETQTQGEWYWDDIGINDNTGGTQNSFPGSGQIVHMQPNAAGDNNMCSAGDHTSVDEVTPDDATTICVLDADNDILDVNTESASSAGINGGDTIKLVQVGVREAAAAAVAQGWNLRLKSAAGGTVSSGTSLTHNDVTYKTNGDMPVTPYPLTSYTDPTTGIAWTPTGTNSLDNMQIGIVSTDADPDVNVSTLWALVEYTSDTTPPTITNVSSDKANGSYTVGEVIDIDVTFSENVTSTGNVTVTLETGTTDRTCTFAVTNASTGTCNYTVEAGDTSADLQVLSIAGTIDDTSGNDMVNFVPGTNLAANKAIVIDTTAPATPGTPDLNANTDTGTSNTDDITSDATPDFDITCEDGATVEILEGVGSLGTGVCAGGTVTITSSVLTEGAHLIKASQEDVAGNVSAESAELSATIDTTAPTITNVSSDKANGSYTVGEVIDIDVTFSENVTSTGNVTVTLETGVTDRTCTFTVTNSTTGTCNYTVIDGDASADLEVSSLAGTIEDIAGNDMVNFTPATNLAANKAIVVDTTPAPAPSSGGSSSSSGSKRRPTTIEGPTITPNVPPAVNPPTPAPENPVVKIIDNFIPSFLKPKEEAAIPPVVEEFVEETTPLAFQGLWNLLPERTIERFVLAPLPTEIQILTSKFPDLAVTLNEVGVAKLTDLSKIQKTVLKLPGLTERSALPEGNLIPGNILGSNAVPLSDIPVEQKEILPSEFVFARSSGGSIDLNVLVTIDTDGNIGQEVSTISGQQLRLIMKPESPAESVKGYLAFKSATRQTTTTELSTSSLAASPMFAIPAIAQSIPENSNPTIEEKFIVAEFEYTDTDGDGIYTADIIAPVVGGVYEVITIIDYINPTLGRRQIRLTTLVDPEGYIYEKNGNKETRIPQAVVSLFWMNPATSQYELWPADRYQQVNPQTTDVRGTYSFLVPEGTYYTTVTAPMYKEYQGDPFVVSKGNGIHTNIELYAETDWTTLIDWKTSILVIIIVLLGINFYRDRNSRTINNQV